MIVFIMLVAGVAALILGAELLIRGASRLAAAAGISSLVVGLTVVSFGTSAPELAVTVGSGLTGRPDVGVGNVVGSNILNIFFILGLSAAVRPLIVSHELVRREIPILIGVTLAVWLLAANGVLGRLEGIVLLLVCGAYTGLLMREARKTGRPGGRRQSANPSEPEEQTRPGIPNEFESSTHPGGPTEAGDPSEPEEQTRSTEKKGADEQASTTYRGLFRGRDLFLVLAGLVLLLVGARWLVEGSVAVATALGVSEVIIGLTVVALGTSLPEVATSVLASMRGERDIAVGNVVGSNVFNLTLILGAGSVFTPDGLPVAPSILTFDMPIMVAATVACLPVFFTGYRIARWEGWLFLGYYVAYTLYLVLAASRHDALDEFSVVMAYFVVPLTVITLILLAVRFWRNEGVDEGPEHGEGPGHGKGREHGEGASHNDATTRNQG